MQGMPPRGGAKGADYEVYEWVVMDNWPSLEELAKAGDANADDAASCPPTTPVPEQSLPSEAVKTQETLAQTLEKAKAAVAPFSHEGMHPCRLVWCMGCELCGMY